MAESYLALADLLDALPPERWDVPSLCEGWRIREVVAHMGMPARYGEDAFMAELRECEFDFTRLSNRIAARDAQLPTAELVADLRSEVLHDWSPPGGGADGALSHVAIHGFDITVPLGEVRRTPDAAAVHVLDQLVRGGAHAHFGTDISNHEFQATDVDWSYGSGPLVKGPIDDLILRTCGRTVPGNRLTGD